MYVVLITSVIVEMCCFAITRNDFFFKIRYIEFIIFVLNFMYDMQVATVIVKLICMNKSLYQLQLFPCEEGKL